jgi:hypothetical protein
MKGRGGEILTLHQALAPSGTASRGGGLKVRFNPFVSLFAASLIALLPLHAQAQESSSTPNPDNSVSVRERARPELDPQGVRLGAFRLDASLGLDVTSTDNLFAEADEPVGTPDDDMIYTVSPYARLASGWSRHSLVAEAGGAFNSHEDFSNEDADSYFGRLAGRFDVGADTDINASARVGHEFTPRTDPESPDVGSPVEYDRTDYSIGVAHRFARLTARVDATQSDREYDGVDSFRDNERSALRGRVDIALSPRIGLLVQGTVDERDYSQPLGNDLSSEGAALLVGATINGNLMRGEVSVGQFERDYDDPLFGEVDGVAVAGELEWYITQLTTLTFDAQRTPDDSPSVNSPYVTTEFGVQVDHELLRSLIVSAGARMGDRDYESSPREDEYVRYEVGADYILNRRVALRARYSHDDVDSNGFGREFEVNAATVGLSLRL